MDWKWEGEVSQGRVVIEEECWEEVGGAFTILVFERRDEFGLGAWGVMTGKTSVISRLYAMSTCKEIRKVNTSLRSESLHEFSTFTNTLSRPAVAPPL